MPELLEHPLSTPEVALLGQTLDSAEHLFVFPSEVLYEVGDLETTVAGVLDAPVDILKEPIGVLDLIVEVAPLHERLELAVEPFHPVMALAHDALELVRITHIAHLVHRVVEAEGDVLELGLHLGDVEALVGHLVELLEHAVQVLIDHGTLVEEVHKGHLLHSVAEDLLGRPGLTIHG